MKKETVNLLEGIQNNIKEDTAPNYDHVVDSSEVENMAIDDMVNLYCNIAEDAKISIFDVVQQLYVGGAIDEEGFKQVLIDTLDDLNSNL